MTTPTPAPAAAAKADPAKTDPSGTPTVAPLTPEEIAEFRALREEKKAHDEQVAREVEEAAARLQPHTHFVHLADGAVTEGSTIATHVDNGDGPLPVTGTYAKPEFVTFPA